MKEEKTEERNITEVVLSRFNQVKSVGGVDVPKDFSPENALKSAWFKLQTVQDKDKKPALSICSQTSIANSLYEMVTSGLNPMKNQCYFVVYGKELTLMKSYQGNIALAKRYSGVKSVIAREIYEKDIFTTKINTDGREILIEHQQPFANTDNDIIGGYCVIIDSEGVEHLTKMTSKKIKASWSMGKAKGNSKFHTDFDDEAVKRTLINRACKPYINSSNDENVINQDAKNQIEEKEIISIETTETIPQAQLGQKEEVQKKEPEVLGIEPEENKTEPEY